MEKQSAMKPADEARLVRLLRQQRWAALGTHDPAGQQAEPYVSWVAFFAKDDLSGFVMHLSRLAPHTRNILALGRASLALTEPDDGMCNPQQLARASIRGAVEEINPQHSDYESLKQRYIARFPDAEMLFEFADFSLFCLVPDELRYVEGFASTHRFKLDRLLSIAAQTLA